MTTVRNAKHIHPELPPVDAAAKPDTGTFDGFAAWALKDWYLQDGRMPTTATALWMRCFNQQQPANQPRTD
jgi:hypothetical protein